MDLDATLVCLACKADFDAGLHAPMQLPCLHLQCAQCVLAGTEGDARRDNVRHCAFLYESDLPCNAPFRLDEARAHVPLKLAAQDAATTANSQPSAHTCDECVDTHPAVFVCETCTPPGHLCRKQADAHRASRKTVDHTLRALAGDIGRGCLCTKHKSEETFAFCEQCCRLVCTKCIVEPDHQGHRALPPSDGLLHMHKALNDRLQELDGMVPGLESCLTTFDETMKHLVLTRRRTLEDIRTWFDDILNQLRSMLLRFEQRRNDLLSEASTALSADIKEMQQQRDGVFIALQHIKDARDAYALLWTPFTSAQTAGEVTLGALESRPDLMRPLIVEASFLNKRMASLLNQAISETPRVTKSKVFSPGTVPEVALALNMDDLGALVDQTLPVTAHDYTKPITAPKWSAGQALVGSGPVIATTFSNPIGVASVDGHIVIGDQSNQRIVVIDSRTSQVARTILINDYVYGISCCIGPKKDEFWVATYNFGLLRCVSGTGEILDKIPCMKAYGVVALPDGDLVVSCYDANYVMRLRADGSQRWRSTGAEFKYAMHLCVIGIGDELAVCDRNNNRIQILSLSTGAFVRQIPTSGSQVLNLPTGVTYDNQAKILIVAELHAVSFWQLDGTFVGRWDNLQLNNGYGACTFTDGAMRLLVVVDCDNNRILCF